MIGFYNYTVLLTYLGFSSSVLGIILAMTGHTFAAIFCLMFSGLCDMFDGKVARTKKNRTKDERQFGVQLDSLSDLVCFGILPSVIGFKIGLKEPYMIIVLVFYSLAALIRLAYFNVLAEEKTVFNKKKKEKVSYYYGLPVTSIAIILPFTYNLNIFMHPSVFLKAYPLIMLMTAILFVLNIKIKKPTGIWYVICSILAVIEIAIISAVMR